MSTEVCELVVLTLSPRNCDNGIEQCGSEDRIVLKKEPFTTLASSIAKALRTVEERIHVTSSFALSSSATDSSCSSLQEGQEWKVNVLILPAKEHTDRVSSKSLAKECKRQALNPASILRGLPETSKIIDATILGDREILEYEDPVHGKGTLSSIIRASKWHYQTCFSAFMTWDTFRTRRQQNRWKESRLFSIGCQSRKKRALGCWKMYATYSNITRRRQIVRAQIASRQHLCSKFNLWASEICRRRRVARGVAALLRSRTLRHMQEAIRVWLAGVMQAIGERRNLLNSTWETREAQYIAARDRAVTSLTRRVQTHSMRTLLGLMLAFWSVKTRRKARLQRAARLFLRTSNRKSFTRVFAMLRISTAESQRMRQAAATVLQKRRRDCLSCSMRAWKVLKSLSLLRQTLCARAKKFSRARRRRLLDITMSEWISRKLRASLLHTASDRLSTRVRRTRLRVLTRRWLSAAAGRRATRGNEQLLAGILRSRRLCCIYRCWRALAAAADRFRIESACEAAMAAHSREALEADKAQAAEDRRLSAVDLAIRRRRQQSAIAACVSRWARWTTAVGAYWRAGLMVAKRAAQRRCGRVLMRLGAWSAEVRRLQLAAVRAAKVISGGRVSRSWRSWRSRTAARVAAERQLASVRRRVCVWEDRAALSALRWWAKSAAARRRRFAKGERAMERLRARAAIIWLRAWRESILVLRQISRCAQAYYARLRRVRLARRMHGWRAAAGLEAEERRAAALAQKTAAQAVSESTEASVQRQRQLVATGAKAARRWLRAATGAAWRAWEVVASEQRRRRGTARRMLGRVLLYRAARALGAWVANAQEERRRRRAVAVVVRRIVGGSMARALMTWRACMYEARRRGRVEVATKTTLARLRGRAAAAALRGWAERGRHVRRLRTVCVRVVACLRNRLLAAAARLWSERAAESRRLRAVASRVVGRLKDARLAHVLEWWRDAATKAVHDKRTETEAKAAAETAAAESRRLDVEREARQASGVEKAARLWRNRSVAMGFSRWTEVACRLRGLKRSAQRVLGWMLHRTAAIAFSRLREQVAELVRLRRVASVVVKRLLLGSAARCVCAWRACLDDSRARRSRVGRVVTCIAAWRRRQAKAYTLQWVMRTKELMGIKVVCRKIVLRLSNRRLYAALDRWAVNASESLRLKGCTRRVVGRWRATRLSRALEKWQASVAVQIEEKNASKEAETAIDRVKRERELGEARRERQLAVTAKKIVKRWQNMYLTNFYSFWADSVKDSKRLRHFASVVIGRIRHQLAGRAWIRFKGQTAELRVLRQKISIVLESIMQSQRLRALRAWQDNVQEAHAWQARIDRAFTWMMQWQKRNLCYALHGWRAYCCDVRRCKVICYKIILRMRNRRLISALDSWINHAAESRRLRLCLSRVMARIQNVTLARSFVRWRVSARQSVNEEEAKQAEETAAKNLASEQAFKNTRREEKAAQIGQRIILAWKKLSLNSIFAYWKVMANDTRRLKDTARLVVGRLKNKEYVNIWNRWTEYTAERVRMQAIGSAAACKMFLSCEHRMTQKWKTAVHAARQRKRQMKRSRKYFKSLQRKDFKSLFKAWLQHIDRLHRLKKCGFQVLVKMRKRDLAAALYGWSSNVFASKKNRRCAQQVVKRLRHRLLMQTIERWQTSVAESITSRYEKGIIADDAARRELEQKAEQDLRKSRLDIIKSRMIKKWMHKSVSAAFTRWQTECRNVQRLRHAAGLVIGRLRHRGLTMAWIRFKSQTVERIRLKAIGLSVIRRLNRFRSKQVLVTWVRHYQNKKARSSRSTGAITMSHVYQNVAAMSIIREWCKYSRLRVILFHLGSQVTLRSRIRHLVKKFDQWLSWLCKNKKLRWSMRRVIACVYCGLVLKNFDSWRSAVKFRKTAQEIKDISADYAQQKTKIDKCLSRRNRQLHSISDMLQLQRLSTVLAVSVILWAVLARKSRYLRRLAVRILERVRGKAISGVLARLKARIVKKKMMWQVRVFLVRKILCGCALRALKTWNLYIERRSIRKRRCQRASTQYNKALLSDILLFMNLNVNRKRRLESIFNRISNQALRRRICVLFWKWATTAVQSRCLASRLDQLLPRLCKRRKHQYFSSWRSLLARPKSDIDLAEAERAKTISHVLRSDRDHVRISNACQRLFFRYLLLTTSDAVLRWSAFTKKTRRIRLALELVVSRTRHSFCRKFWNAFKWKMTCKLRLRWVKDWLMHKFFHGHILKVIRIWQDYAYECSMIRRRLNRAKSLIFIMQNRSVFVALHCWLDKARKSRRLKRTFRKCFGRLEIKQTNSSFHKWRKHVKLLKRHRCTCRRIATRLSKLEIATGFERWKDNVEEQLRRKDDAGDAEKAAISKENLQNLEKAARDKQLETVSQQIVKRWLQNSLYQGFHPWSVFVRKERRLQVSARMIMGRWRQSGCSRAWIRFKNQVFENRRLRQICSHVIQRSLQLLICRSIRSWQCHYLYKKRKGAKTHRARVFLTCMLSSCTKSALNSWSAKALDSRRLTNLCSKIVTRMRFKHLATSIELWRIHASELRRLHQTAFKVVCRLKNAQSAHTFNAWLHWTAEERRKQTEQIKGNESAEEARRVEEIEAARESRRLATLANIVIRRYYHKFCLKVLLFWQASAAKNFNRHRTKTSVFHRLQRKYNAKSWAVWSSFVLRRRHLRNAGLLIFKKSSCEFIRRALRGWYSYGKELRLSGRRMDRARSLFCALQRSEVIHVFVDWAHQAIKQKRHKFLHRTLGLRMHRKRLHTVIMAWSRQILGKRRNDRVYHYCKNRLQNSLLSKSVSSWKSVAANTREEKRQIAAAEEYAFRVASDKMFAATRREYQFSALAGLVGKANITKERHLMKIAFKELLKLSTQSNFSLRGCWYLYRRGCLRALTSVLRLWKHATYRQHLHMSSLKKSERRLLARAICGWLKNVGKRQVLRQKYQGLVRKTVWRILATCFVEFLDLTFVCRRLEQIISAINKDLLKHTLYQWRRVRVGHRAMRLRFTRQKNRRTNRVLKRLMTGWGSYASDGKRRRIWLKACSHRSNNVVLGRMVRLWYWTSRRRLKETVAQTAMLLEGEYRYFKERLYIRNKAFSKFVRNMQRRKVLLAAIRRFQGQVLLTDFSLRCLWYIFRRRCIRLLRLVTEIWCDWIKRRRRQRRLTTRSATKSKLTLFADWRHLAAAGPASLDPAHGSENPSSPLWPSNAAAAAWVDPLLPPSSSTVLVTGGGRQMMDGDGGTVAGGGDVQAVRQGDSDPDRRVSMLRALNKALLRRVTIDSSSPNRT